MESKSSQKMRDYCCKELESSYIDIDVEVQSEVEDKLSDSKSSFPSLQYVKSWQVVH